MTTHEMSLFSELLEVNWRISNGEYDPIMKTALRHHYSHLVSRLEESMGSDAWRGFLSTGRQMFAPKGGYGDESPEEVNRMMESVR